jgi:hypothetical protein
MWIVGLSLWASTAVAGGKIEKDGWEKLSDKNGVQVYRKSEPGSPLKSIKGSGVVNAPVATVALVLLDDDRVPEWVDSLAVAKVVRTSGPYEYVEYNLVTMPLWVRNREFITRVWLSVDRPNKTAIIRSVPADEPSIKRTRNIRGDLTAYYQMKSIDDDKHTLLTVELHSDPKGSLPAWLVNYFQKDWAHATIEGIRSQVKKKDLKPPPDFAQYLGELDFSHD